VQFNRALINARDEPLGDPTRFRRLHLLLGDSNVLPFSNALKVGATSLLLDLVEADLIPKGLALADPVRSMRQISYDPDGSWIVEMADGRKWSALDVLGELYEVAASPKLDKDQDGLWTCRAWEEVLVAFQEKRKEDLIGKVDWVTKRYLLEAFREAEGLEWDDPWLESLDLEYHKIDPAQNLARLLPNTGVTDVDLPGYPKQDPRYFPPANTRAKVRSQLMHTIAQTGRDYIIDWDYVQFGKLRYFTLDDPFESRVPELEWKRAWA
jgi:proteasome accessory factor A